MFSFGDARFFGSTGAMHLNAPIVGMASTRSGRGYWLVTADGSVFAYGNARHLHATRRRVANESIVGIAASTTTGGIWLAASGNAGPKVEAAIGWFESRTGNSSYEELCETAVELAYGTISQYPTARADWLARPDKHPDWWNAPRGALVFYDTSADGHVAISLGNGQVVSTSVYHRIGVAPIGFFQNPLGWANEPW
jgi:hypothetical protein